MVAGMAYFEVACAAVVCAKGPRNPAWGLSGEAWSRCADGAAHAVAGVSVRVKVPLPAPPFGTSKPD